MSLNAEALSAPEAARARLWPRLMLAVAAVAIVAGGVALLLWLFAPAAPPPPPPRTRNPFGMGVREAAPAASGLGAYILALQGSFFRSLRTTVAALKESGAAFGPLMAIGFAYGVFHAAGPGHGKAVIAAYLVASERALLKGVTLSLAAAVLQAVVAIAIVGVAAALLRATAATMDRVTSTVELVSFAAVTALGIVLTWRKAGKVLGVAALARGQADAAPGADCGHVHLPPPGEIDRMRRLREMAGVVLAAGIRPCAGAIVVLVFALSQGLFAAGVAATFAMALGTALTTGAIATLAVFAKAAALRLAGGRGATAAVALAGVELLAAAFVLVLGGSLLMGVWSAGGGS